MSIPRSRNYFQKLMNDAAHLDINEADVQPIESREVPHRAWVGFDPDGNAVAFFEAPATASQDFSVSQVIDVRLTGVAVESTGENVNCIKLVCRDSRLNEVFYVFVDELLERLVGKKNTYAIVQEAARDWRRLLQLVSVGFTVNAATGLYGELCFLEQAILNIGPDALDTWQRSQYDMHDVISDEARVEVKTSKFQNESAVSVHGLKQLAVPARASLTLAVAEVDVNSGELIDDVIHRILSLGVDISTLVEKLASIGYVIGMPEAQEYRFTISSWRFWEISSGSPVLSSTSLPMSVVDAISSVSYKLQLSALGASSSEYDFSRLSRESE